MIDMPALHNYKLKSISYVNGSSRKVEENVIKLLN